MMIVSNPAKRFCFPQDNNISQGASMRSVFFLACSAVILFSGCAAHHAGAANSVQAPVLVSNSVREALPGDYLRVSFLPAGVAVTSLSRPGASRAFTTATLL